MLIKILVLVILIFINGVFSATEIAFLSINKYKKVEYVPVEYPPTEEILANILELNKEIDKELTELKDLLGIQKGG